MMGAGVLGVGRGETGSGQPQLCPERAECVLAAMGPGTLGAQSRCFINTEWSVLNNAHNR